MTLHDLIDEARRRRDAAMKALTDERDHVEACYQLGHLDAILDRMAAKA